MRFIVALSLFAAIASAEVTPVPFFSTDKNGSPIGDCSAVSSSTQLSPKWTNKFVYPIEVCGVFYGRMDPCTPAPKAEGDSKIVLSVVKGKDTIASVESKFVLAKQVDAVTTLYCSTFQPCDILSKLSAVNPAVALSEIELLGTVSVEGVQKSATPGGTDPRLSALMRTYAVAVSSKVKESSTSVSEFSANYAVVREDTFCEEGYECITTVNGATAEMTKTTQKMMLLEGASYPTCDYKENAEGTKLHLTVLTKKEGVCQMTPADCKGKVTILDQDKDTGSASSLAVISSLTLTTLLAMSA